MKLAFVQMFVRNYSASCSWYRDVLGLAEVMRDEADRFALLEAPGGGRVALKEGEPTTGALLAFEVEELDAEVKRVTKAGAQREGEVKCSEEGYRRARLRDPDGNAVTLFEWRR